MYTNWEFPRVSRWKINKRTDLAHLFAEEQRTREALYVRSVQPLRFSFSLSAVTQ